MAALGPVKFLTIHCAATPEGRDVKAATIGEWDKAKFGQISYHYVVEIDGTVVPTLPETTRGAHVGRANTGNLGICYVGGVDRKGNAKDTRTPAQRSALAKLVKRLQAKYPGIIVRGHRDWPGVNKACPSFDVSAWLKSTEFKGA